MKSIWVMWILFAVLMALCLLPVVLTLTGVW